MSTLEGGEELLLTKLTLAAYKRTVVGLEEFSELAAYKCDGAYLADMIEGAHTALEDILHTVIQICPDCGGASPQDDSDLIPDEATEPLQLYPIALEFNQEDGLLRATMRGEDAQVVQVTDWVDVTEVEEKVYDINSALIETLRNLADQIERKMRLSSIEEDKNAGSSDSI